MPSRRALDRLDSVMNTYPDWRLWIGLAAGVNLGLWALLGLLSAATSAVSAPVAEVLLLTLFMRGIPGALLTAICIGFLLLAARNRKNAAMRWPHVLIASLLVSGMLRWAPTGWDFNGISLSEVLFTSGIDALSAALGLLLHGRMRQTERL